jgi:uncharacterized protein YycO
MTKKHLFLIITFLLSFGLALTITNKVFAQQPETTFKDGDMIFQTSQSTQCEAVRMATNSKFSHCGLIYIVAGKPIVFEAVQPVKLTPLSDWIQHGEGNKYIVKRLKNSSVLTPQTIKTMKAVGKKMIDKNYDLFFEWSDDKIYCSELIWKIYKKGANIELCQLQKLKDFNLTDKKVKTILAERYGKNIPLNEAVVSPESIEKSDLLETVFDNYKH